MSRAVLLMSLPCWKVAPDFIYGYLAKVAVKTYSNTTYHLEHAVPTMKLTVLGGRMTFLSRERQIKTNLIPTLKPASVLFSSIFNILNITYK